MSIRNPGVAFQEAAGNGNSGSLSLSIVSSKDVVLKAICIELITEALEVDEVKGEGVAREEKSKDRALWKGKERLTIVIEGR